MRSTEVHCWILSPSERQSAVAGGKAEQGTSPDSPAAEGGLACRHAALALRDGAQLRASEELAWAGAPEGLEPGVGQADEDEG